MDVTTLTFDALGRMTAFDDGTPVAYTYDALDRIATRGTAAFTYAGTTLDPATAGGFTYSRTPGGHLLGLSDGTTSLLAGTNRHGDLAYAFGTGGAVQLSRVYEPFGEVAGSTGALQPPVGYQGDYTDPASGQVWMGARWYAPQTASFASRDSVFGDASNPVSLNRYTYAYADPLEYVDPDGREGILTQAARREAEMNRIFTEIGAFPSSGPDPFDRAFAKLKANIAYIDVKGLGHLGLSVLGAIPGPIGAGFDLANAAWYLGEGDLKNATLSTAQATLAWTAPRIARSATGIGKKLTAKAVAEGTETTVKEARGASTLLRAPVKNLAKAEGIGAAEGLGSASAVARGVSPVNVGIGQGFSRSKTVLSGVDYQVASMGSVVGLGARRETAVELATTTALSSGGRTAPRWRWGSSVGDADASEAYAAIRASTTDVRAVARYTGLNERSVSRLGQMKEYLFNNPEWTAPDPEIASAWHRLRTGRGTGADMQLLRHETAEMWYRRNIADDYGAAHAAANRHWNWEATVQS